jgi:hypothetical protein
MVNESTGQRNATIISDFVSNEVDLLNGFVGSQSFSNCKCTIVSNLVGWKLRNEREKKRERYVNN